MATAHLRNRLKKWVSTNNKMNSRDAAFGDFDDDGDIDLFVVNENGSNALYSNQRQGAFKDITAESGLKSTGGSGAVAVGDYNNDGFLDLFITSVNGSGQQLFRNKGNGTFEPEKRSAEMFSAIKGIKAWDAKFFDFDNDGFQDLIIAGESEVKGGRGIFLYHNDGKGNFEDVSRLLPEEPKSGRQIALFDYNDDGDLDVVIAGLNGGVYLLRNDGGNINHYVKMKLIGLRAGSAKNNHFGIGAKVEMRAGDLYQSMVVTDPNVHFGLGNRSKADVIRITWTNGVPQNIFSPGSDQALIEAQTLKGSCPFLFTWDGDKFVFVKDVMWRSALGMPLGIMGGNTAYAFPDASDDYIKVPGDLLKQKNGLYSIQLTSELWETMFFDKVQLVAVDHPDSIDIFVPEQFSPPPFPGNQQYQVKEKHIPVSATDSQGNNVLSFIAEKDDKYLSDFKPDKYQGVTEMHDLILDPGEVGKSKNLLLFLNGWIFPTDASINVALSQSSDLKVVRPFVQVINAKGEWETVIENLGFPMGKDKTVITDLSSKFLSVDHRIRIRTNMEIYWDYVFFSDKASNVPVISSVLTPVSADLELVAYVKSNAQKLNIAHAGVGSIGFSCGLLFNSIIGVKPTSVPFNGAGPAMNALIGGQVDYMCDGGINNSVPHVQSGTIKAYAIGSEHRSPVLPNVPTSKEAGLPEFQVSGWLALFAPKGTPKPILDKLTDALDKALDDDNSRKRLLDLGTEIPDQANRGQQPLAALVKSEIARWTPIIKAANVKAE